MARRKRAQRREIIADPIYNSEVVSALVGKVLERGKKATAEGIVYGAIEKLGEKTGKPGIDVLNEAIQNVKPVMEVKSRRVGGANYQVPVEVRADRAISLALRWIVLNSRAKKGRAMSEALTSELMDAYNKTGASMKKKDDTHKMAEANKAFAHFRW